MLHCNLLIAGKFTAVAKWIMAAEHSAEYILTILFGNLGGQHIIWDGLLTPGTSTALLGCIKHGHLHTRYFSQFTIKHVAKKHSVRIRFLKQLFDTRI